MTGNESLSFDEVLELAAQTIEQPDLIEALAVLRGQSARRRRDREEAAVRRAVCLETRAKAAEQIRALKGSRKTDGLIVLRRLAALDPGADHTGHVRDAWPLHWLGWCDIAVTLSCTSNVIPPTSQFRVTLTERGRTVLAEADRRAAATPLPSPTTKDPTS